MKRRVVAVVALVASVAALLPAGRAAALWLAESSASTTSTADTLGAGATPTVSAAGATATISWAASTLTTTGVAATAYTVTRLDAGNAETTVTCGSPSTLTSCTEHGVPAGTWTYKVTPAFHNWTGTASAASAAVTITAPSFTITANQSLHPGDPVAGASIANFDVGESVDFLLDGSGTPLTTATVGATGGIASVSLTLPNDTAGGTHTITAQGSVSTATSASFTVLVEPPTITAQFTGTAGTNGWYTSAVTATLTAVDRSGTGIASFSYDLDSAGSTPVVGLTKAVSISTTGQHTLTGAVEDNLAQTGSYSGTVDIDLVSPTVSFVPSGYVNRSTSLSVTASDAESGMASVRYDACAGTSCTPSTALGTSTTGPSYGLTWPVGYADGSYQVQAVAKDVAGRTTTSTKRTIVLDDTAPTVSLSAPANGATIGGTSVTFTASVDDSPAVWTTSGSNLVFQYSPTGANSWSTLLDPTGSTTTGTKNMTAIVDGTYDLRAVATDKAGNVTNSATTTFVVQNWTASTVTTGNVVLGTAGRMQLGDTLTIVYSQAMAVSSFCSTWSGDGSNQSASVTVTITDGGAGNDTLTMSSGSCLINFGTLDLGNTGYTSAGATFDGTVTWTVASRTLSLSLGLFATGSVTTEPTGGKATYTPSSSLISAAGVPIKTTVKQTTSAGLQF